MTKTILGYGAASGAAIIATMTACFAYGSGPGSTTSEMWFGYLLMIVALSVIFVGVKRYRDRELGGVIRFKEAFQIGLGITLIACAVYVLGWEAYLAATDHAFIQQYTSALVEAKEAAGVGGKELQAYVADMEAMKESYANPLFRMPMTFLEMFPVGLLVALISAAVLRKSHVLPAGGPAPATATG
jgi:hypothetical protein